MSLSIDWVVVLIFSSLLCACTVQIHQLSLETQENKHICTNATNTGVRWKRHTSPYIVDLIFSYNIRYYYMPLLFGSQWLLLSYIELRVCCVENMYSVPLSRFPVQMPKTAKRTTRMMMTTMTDTDNKRALGPIDPLHSNKQRKEQQTCCTWCLPKDSLWLVGWVSKWCGRKKTSEGIH